MSTVLSSNYAYPDLLSSDYVFNALLGYGMFAEKLPPCFSSEEFLNYIKTKAIPNKSIHHGYIQYQSARNTTTYRTLSIPHPESYWLLCNQIKRHWNTINNHIGKPNIKFSFCHVQRIKGKNHIFEMSYNDSKYYEEELKIQYSLGCKYVVEVDISSFFPSVYSHSIPWAVYDKSWAKIHRCTANNKKKNKGVVCKINHNQPCPNDIHDLWPNDIDEFTSALKFGETNGLLIGPHTSNIISEIVLSKVDCMLQKNGFAKVIRHIDDYLFFADSQEQVSRFIRELTIGLKYFELSVNTNKTRIIPFEDYEGLHWKSKLNQFIFPIDRPIGFPTINSYIDLAYSISKAINDYAPLKYAIRVISQKTLSIRSKRLYVKKILQLSLCLPYILPLLNDYVLNFCIDVKAELSLFVQILFNRAIIEGVTDSLAFALYFVIRNNIDLDINDNILDSIIELSDCISMLLAHKYCEKIGYSIEKFQSKAIAIQSLPDREQDSYWLFMLETLPKSNLRGFLKELKENMITFLVGL